MEFETLMLVNQSLCLARLPRAGLGNKLLVWGRARVFANLNGLPFQVTGWNHFSPGAIIRGEIGRQYFGHFRGQKEISQWAWLRARALFKKIRDPDVATIVPAASRIYVFQKVPHWGDYFEHIRDHREMIRTALLDAVAQPFRNQAACLPAPVIGLHVRHGDFRTLKPGEDFARVGLVRTPLTYFKLVVQLIRDVAGAPLPVTVFSDGHPEALAELLALPNVTRHQPRAAITDLLLMSRSRILVTSAGSTFSYWAAFLSEAAVLLHPSHIHAPLRPAAVNGKIFEGPAPSVVGECPALLRDNIRAIR
jgi:hypothetical protein